MTVSPLRPYAEKRLELLALGTLAIAFAGEYLVEQFGVDDCVIENRLKEGHELSPLLLEDRFATLNSPHEARRGGRFAGTRAVWCFHPKTVVSFQWSGHRPRLPFTFTSVSYTHLTLPTKRIV